MEVVMKKLALWHTGTFRPFMTHDDLEPIMTSLGFVPFRITPVFTTSTEPTTSSSSSATGNGSSVEWKEYTFSAASASAADADDRDHLPRPRLPFPRIDGLHLLTYRAFIDAVGFYLGTPRVADHFHVRGMPLHRVHDRIFDRVFRRMNDERRAGEDEGIFVFRVGTLDQATMSLCGNNSSISINSSIYTNSSSNANPICLVPLKDIIPLKDIAV